MYLEITPEPFVVYRSIGPCGGERYGVGLVDKNDNSCDFSNRAHKAYVLCLLLRGRGCYQDRFGNEYPLGPGSVFQRFPGIPATVNIIPGSGWLECFLELGDNMASMLEQYGCCDRSKPVLQTSLPDMLAERFFSLRTLFLNCGETVLAAHLPEIMALAQDCLTETAPTNRDEERRHMVEKACIHLSTHFELPDRLEEFCRKNCIGYENFRKIFKQATGMSPHHYRVRRRLDEACALLTKSELSITEISRVLGYSSPYEFSAQFRRQVGVPPSSYRNN
jgi:AraC-like DNA-binding protein